MTLLEIVTQFNTQSKCIRYLESIRWPMGPVCPYCKSTRQTPKTKEDRYTCNDCNISFSVKVGTLFESSKLPLAKWFMAIVLIKDAKKGISSLQLARHLDVNKNTAWFLQSRIRRAMKETLTLSGTVEIDETYIGGSVTNMHKSYVEKNNIYPGGMEHKTPVLGMIERKGQVVLKVLQKADKKTIRPIIKQKVDFQSLLITDGFGPYRTLKKEFNQHVTINHEKKQKALGEYNLSSIEGFWAMLKRAIMGVYHKISLKHLQSYMDEIAFKFNHKYDKCMFKSIIDRLIATSFAII